VSPAASHWEATIAGREQQLGGYDDAS